ncbi:Double stranded RNA binding protein 1-1 [Rhynchospora pubera]|uniref:Double stranded RNA binding protein 1-1 n=1 Tax=Rhynchospora pubera TaxID=906938 RepID=A0AAV8G944_9POAL|nr:Double stranded RNA binding protein 1-1 [Rhynchospora pubera]
MESGAPPSKTSGMGNCYVFKSRLQEYAQKAGFKTPEYHTLKEGLSHVPIFRSTVVVNDVRYDSLPGFSTRKVAEQSAAEVALLEILKSGQLTECIPALHETGLCKNMLQEYAQKMNYAIPSYVCSRQTVGSAPYVCTVEIGGIQYIGAAATTKKEAEIKAARTALLAIQGQENAKKGASQYTVLPTREKTPEPEKTVIPAESKKLKSKKKISKKRWRPKRFMKKQGNEDNATRDNITNAAEALQTGDILTSEAGKFVKEEFRSENQVGANCENNAGSDQIRAVSNVIESN